MSGTRPPEASLPTSRGLQAMEEGLTTLAPRIASDPHSNCNTSLRKRIISAAKAGNAEEILMYDSMYLSARNDDDLSPLHIAVIAGHHNVVESVLPSDVNSSGRVTPFTHFDLLHARTRRGYTAIHLAVISGNEGMLRLLISKYGEIHKRPECEWDFADIYWMTPLHYAVLGNQKAAIEQLLEWPYYNGHVNAREYFQRTPLHLAACHRPVSVDRLLQHPCVDVNARDCLSLTPLHWAVYFGRTDIVRSLVELSRKSLTNRTVHAVCRDIGERSVLEIAMEDSLLDLIPAVSDKPTCVPFEHDKLFLREKAATIHREVNFEIEKLLLSCSDVVTEKGDLDRNLGFYGTAINATIFVAALIAGAVVGMSTDSLDSDSEGASKSNFLRAFFFLKAISFYGSVATVLAGATVLRPLGKSVPIARRVEYARNALSRLSLIVALSTCFFLMAFYTQTATRVGNDEPVTELRTPYHIVSAVAIGLCSLLVLSFIRLHQHMRLMFSEVEFSKECIKIWWESIWVVVILSLLFVLEKLCFRKISVADTVIDHYVQYYGRSGQKSRIFVEARKLYEAHLESKRFQSQDVVQDSFSEIHQQIETAFRGAWQSTRRAHFRAGKSDEGTNFGVEEKLLADKADKGKNLGAEKSLPEKADAGKNLGLAEKYWQRRGVSSRDKHVFKRIEEEILHTKRAYRRLTKKKGGMGRNFMCFLDLLPHGLLFWLDDWITLWRGKITIFYCGHMLEYDTEVYKKIQKEFLRED